MSESIETRLERLRQPTPTGPDAHQWPARVAGPGEVEHDPTPHTEPLAVFDGAAHREPAISGNIVLDGNVAFDPSNDFEHAMRFDEGKDSLTWQAPNEAGRATGAQSRDLPTTTAVQRRVAEAYTALHGHPLEHDGRIATARRRARWKLSLRSGVSLCLLLVVIVGIVLTLEAWNRAETARELTQLTGSELEIEEPTSSDQRTDKGAGEGTEPPGNETHEGENPQASSTETENVSQALESSPPTVFVHVAGQVAQPGLYELPANARAHDAIEAAGGLTGKSDTDVINLASPVLDGQQVYVPEHGEPPRLTSMGPTDPNAQGDAGATHGTPDATTLGPSSTTAGQVNINTASAEQLDTLPGVGPAIAQRIIEFRQAHGGFASVDDLQSVSGIGPAIMSKLRDHITVSGP